MDDPIEIEKDNPIQNLMEEFGEKARALNAGYALAVVAVGEGWHATRTNLSMDGYFFAVVHCAVEMGTQQGMTKEEVVECMKKQIRQLEDEI